jgi:mannosyltransferase
MRSAAVGFLRSREGLAVVLMTAVGAVIRFATLDQQSYWYDEAVTANMVDGSFGDVLSGIVDTESTPPLYYALAWLWAHVFGSDEASLRALSALVGTLVVPVAFAAGRVVTTARIGVAAAAVAAVSPMLVWYSQEARAYVLLVLLCGLSFVFFARARSDPSAERLAAWAVVSALAIATAYFAAFVVVAEALLLLLAHPRLRRLWWALAAVALVALCLFPLAAAQASHRRLGWVGGIGLGERLGEALQRLVTAAQPSSWAGATGTGVTPYAWIGAVVVLLLAVGVLVAVGSPTERTGAWLAGFVAALGIGLPVGIAAFADLVTNGDGDYFLDRNVLGAWVPLTVFVVAGLAARRAGALGLACIVGIVSWSLVVQIRIVTTPAFQRDDWRAIAVELDDGPPTAVLVYPAYQAGALTRQRPELMETEGSADVERVVLVLTGFEEPPRSFVVPNGFTPSAVRRVQHFVLREYVAARPTHVGPTDVARVPLDDADLALLLER